MQHPLLLSAPFLSAGFARPAWFMLFGALLLAASSGCDKICSRGTIVVDGRCTPVEWLSDAAIDASVSEAGASGSGDAQAGASGGSEPSMSMAVSGECRAGETHSCEAGVGLCAQGIQHCTSGVWDVCAPLAPRQREECDGVDTDCDGQPDNGALCPSGQSCKNGRCVACTDDETRKCTLSGASGPCAQGQQRCSDGAWQACVSATSPDAETCDGEDNDCSGVADDHDPCPHGRACLKVSSAFVCASCSVASAATDCPVSDACKVPSCNATTGMCEPQPAQDLTDCPRAGSFQGFCQAGSCRAPDSADGTDQIGPGQALLPGESIVSGKYKLLYQPDGNVVLWGDMNAREFFYCQSVDPRPAGALIMQPDGELVTYGPTGEMLWMSGTHRPGSYLRLEGSTAVIRSPSGSVVYTLDSGDMCH